MATSPEAQFGAARAAESAGAPVPELAGPREENLARLARLVAARRGDQVRIEEVKGADPAHVIELLRPCVLSLAAHPGTGSTR
jgi:hypothetical protein